MLKIENIKVNLYEKLHITPEEGSKLLLLFFHSFFCGIFVAFYFVTANTEFIQHYDNAQLPFAYLVAGIAGYLITLIYSFLQKRIDTKVLFLGALMFMMLMALSSRIGFSVLQNLKIELGPKGYTIYENYLSFFIFIWAWPFISLTNIEAGGLSLKLLNLAQVKRFFGLINMGGVIAGILGYFTIPFILKILNYHFDLLYIGCVGLLVGIILLFMIYNKFPDKPQPKETIPDKFSFSQFFNLLNNKFILLIFATAIISTILIYIVDYGFLSSIRAQAYFYGDKARTSGYIALVFGGLKIGELLISILSSRILSKYGVKAGLTILPVTSSVIMLLALIAGITFGTSGILFLTLFTILKCVERVLRRGIDDPAFNVLYHTLPENQKLTVQTRVGVTIQFSLALSGLLLMFISYCLTTNKDFNLKYYPLFVLPLLFLWAWLSVKLYNRYKQKIKDILADKKLFKTYTTIEKIFGSQVLEKHLLGSEINSLKLSVVILSETNPKCLEPYTQYLLNSGDTVVTKAVLKNIDPTFPQELSKEIEELGNKTNFKEKEIRKLLLTSLFSLDFSDVLPLSTEQIEKLIHSKSHKDKTHLIKYLQKYNIEAEDHVVYNLLDFHDHNIRISAIKIASKRHSENIFQKLVEMLQYAEYRHILGSTFIEMGNPILKHLDNYFEKEKSVYILLKIIEIYGKIASPESQQLLISHLNYPDRDVQTGVINALYYSEFKANNQQIADIKKKILDICENILWIFASIQDLETRKNTLRLIQSLDLEKEQRFEILFQLMSFIYQPELVDLIKTNVIGKNTIFAIELIDNFIEQDIKQLIIPLFDKISTNYRIKKLKPFFEQQPLPFHERIKDIIIKDYRMVDNWTKVKAIELLSKVHKSKEAPESTDLTVEDYNSGDIWTEETARRIYKMVNKGDLPDELFVCLHHPDELIYSTAAKAIFDESPIKCINYLKTLSDKKQKLINTLLNKENSEDLLMERVKLLRRVFLFFSIPENSLVKLAKIVERSRVKAGNLVYLVTPDLKENIIILLNGSLTFAEKDGSQTKFFKNDIIIKGLNISADAQFLTTQKDSLILSMDRFEYFNLLVIESDIILHMFNKVKTD